MDEGALPAALRAHPRAGRRPAGSSRSAACGSRPTATSRRASRSCARSCTASGSSSTSSAARPPTSGSPTCSATRPRCRRSCSEAGRHVVPHAEDVVERDQPLPAQHVLVGGHRRHAHPHALPARRHVQRRHERGRAREGRAPVRAARRSRIARSIRTATATAAAGPTRAMLEVGAPRWPISTACRASSSTRVASFWDEGARRVAGPAGVGRRALPRVPPGHLHDQRPDQAGQPAQRAGAARGRAVVGRGGAAGRRLDARIPPTSSTRRGSCCCSTSSTTSSPARASTGRTKTACATTRASRR